MKNSNQSQESMILTKLQTGKMITPIDALNDFGCFRLGARIYQLKKRGHDIETVPIRQNGKRFAGYKLQNQIS